MPLPLYVGVMCKLFKLFQSMRGSSTGDVSLDSAQQPSHMAYGNTEKNPQHKELVELESLSRKATHSPSDKYIYNVTATTAWERVVKNTEELNSGHKSIEIFSKLADTRDGCEKDDCEQDLESCGILAFMASTNSIDNPTDRSNAGDNCDGDGSELESCGILAFMSSANSNINSSVQAEGQIPREEDTSRSATSTVVCANSAVKSWIKQDFSTGMDRSTVYLLSANSDETGSERVDVCNCDGGVTRSASTENTEKRYEMLIKSGNTVGLRAMRQLSSLAKQDSARKENNTTALRGFSNPLCGERTSPLMDGFQEIQGQQHYMQEPFPLPGQVPLTRFPLTGDQTFSVSTPALV